MAAVNQNMFDACVGTDRPSGASLLVLPLNLIAQIVSCLDDHGDLARLCRTCRVLNYMALPQLYKNLTLISYDKIRYRGEEPEGMGSASPFSMGLNAVITRPYARLVRSLTLRGDWREQELEEHARVGRVTDSSMMLNISVRAAVDRMMDLETFRWELSTKMLETVYLGLAQLPKLTSLTVRFPSSRHPRPTIVIPAMPHLRYLKITDIDPLCYPDDISTLLWKAKKLVELNMHWSPRMRNAQEPSVMLHDYFRKCISAKQPLGIRSIGLQNLYALHSEEFNTAFDFNTVENVTMLHDTELMNTFVDSTWMVRPPQAPSKIKSIRQDIYSQRHSDFLHTFTGLERLYFVGPTSTDNINSPRQITSSSSALTPTSEANSTSNELIPPSPSITPTNSPSLQASIRDSYLNNIILNHCATLRHLLLPSRWPLSTNTIARLVHASPHLEQLGFATEFSSMETLGILLPFLRNLVALRLLIPTGGSSEVRPQKHPKMPPYIANCAPFEDARTFADFIELDDDVITEKLSEALADQQIFRQLKVFGLGCKGFLLGEYYTVPTQQSQPSGGVQSQTPIASRSASAEVNANYERSPLGMNHEPQYDGENFGPGFLSPHAQPSPKPGPLPPLQQQQQQQQKNTARPPSLLGKRARDEEVSVIPSEHRQCEIPNSTVAPCIVSSSPDRSFRRRVRRVGWDVLKQWEIWGLDTREL